MSKTRLYVKKYNGTIIIFGCNSDYDSGNTTLRIWTTPKKQPKCDELLYTICDQSLREDGTLIKVISNQMTRLQAASVFTCDYDYKSCFIKSKFTRNVIKLLNENNNNNNNNNVEIGYTKIEHEFNLDDFTIGMSILRTKFTNNNIYCLGAMQNIKTENDTTYITVNDGTNRICHITIDGTNFAQFLTRSHAGQFNIFVIDGSIIVKGPCYADPSFPHCYINKGKFIWIEKNSVLSRKIIAIMEQLQCINLWTLNTTNIKENLDKKNFKKWINDIKKDKKKNDENAGSKKRGMDKESGQDGGCKRQKVTSKNINNNNNNSNNNDDKFLKNAKNKCNEIIIDNNNNNIDNEFENEIKNEDEIKMEDEADEVEPLRLFWDLSDKKDMSDFIKQWKQVPLCAINGYIMVTLKAKGNSCIIVEGGLKINISNDSHVLTRLKPINPGNKLMIAVINTTDNCLFCYNIVRPGKYEENKDRWDAVNIKKALSEYTKTNENKLIMKALKNRELINKIGNLKSNEYLPVTQESLTLYKHCINLIINYHESKKFGYKMREDETIALMTQENVETDLQMYNLNTFNEYFVNYLVPTWEIDYLYHLMDSVNNSNRAGYTRLLNITEKYSKSNHCKFGKCGSKKVPELMCFRNNQIWPDIFDSRTECDNLLYALHCIFLLIDTNDRKFATKDDPTIKIISETVDCGTTNEVTKRIPGKSELGIQKSRWSTNKLMASKSCFSKSLGIYLKELNKTLKPGQHIMLATRWASILYDWNYKSTTKYKHEALVQRVCQLFGFKTLSKPLDHWTNQKGQTIEHLKPYNISFWFPSWVQYVKSIDY